MTNFLPDNYEIPESPSAYMKFVEGENTFRVLSSAIVGFEYWRLDSEGKKKPVRAKEDWKEIPADCVVQNGKRESKPFWAFVIFNYSQKRVQILEITQKGIMRAIKALAKNEKWGDPKTFDISINRVGEGLETEYSVMPNPHSPLDPSITKQHEDMNINLEALFDGSDPFSPSDTQTAPNAPQTVVTGSQGGDLEVVDPVVAQGIDESGDIFGDEPPTTPSSYGVH